MGNGFDEGYARYQRLLAQLDTTHDISAKNLLFRQLTEQLSELEEKLKNGCLTGAEEPPGDDPDPTYY